jgi:hypothetical protein
MSLQGGSFFPDDLIPVFLPGAIPANKRNCETLFLGDEAIHL